MVTRAPSLKDIPMKGILASHLNFRTSKAVHYQTQLFCIGLSLNNPNLVKFAIFAVKTNNQSSANLIPTGGWDCCAGRLGVEGEIVVEDWWVTWWMGSLCIHIDCSAPPGHGTGSQLPIVMRSHILPISTQPWSYSPQPDLIGPAMSSTTLSGVPYHYGKKSILLYF